MRRTKQRTEPITAADVRSIRFPLIRRGGYDPRQVDPFLELIARSLEDASSGGPKVDAQYVHSVRFATVRRGGYAPTAVDAFLDRVIDTLDPPGEASEFVGAAAAPASDTPGGQGVSAVALAEAPAAPAPVVAAPAPVVAAPPAPTAPAPAPAPPVPDVAPVPEPAPVAPAAAIPATPEEPSALEIGRGHLERLKVLYEAGVISEKEVTVLAQRVKRKARELHQLSQN